MSSTITQLAEKIIERLIAENIIHPEDRATLIERLTEGKLQSSDWKLAIEKNLDMEKDNE